MHRFSRLPVTFAVAATLIAASCDFPLQLVGDGAFPEHLETALSEDRTAEFQESFGLEGALVTMPNGARRVYRDERAWRDAWVRLGPDATWRPAPPVDFSSEMVVLTTERGETRGEPERFVQFARRNDVLYVVIGREKWDDERCSFLIGEAYPRGHARVHAAIVPRHEGAVEFVEKRLRGDCLSDISPRDPPIETTGASLPTPRLPLPPVTPP